LRITRAQLEYHVYVHANGIEFINLLLHQPWKHWYRFGAGSAGIS